jgi:hypothetical protein
MAFPHLGDDHVIDMVALGTRYAQCGNKKGAQQRRKDFHRRRRIRGTVVNLIRKEGQPPRRRLVIERAANGQARFVEDVRVDHHRRHTFTSEQFLNRTKVLTGLQQMGSKTVPVKSLLRVDS